MTTLNPGPEIAPAGRAPRIAIVTPSYRNDFALAVDLCRSVDQFFDGDYEHILIVPRRDEAMFSSLKSARRRVVTQQSVLNPQGFVHIPVPTRIRIPPFIDLKFRQQWWCKGVGRISGWVTQQLIKLSASQLTDAELLLFMDSDVMLFRPLGIRRLLTQGRINLHRAAMRGELNEHQQWHRCARQILGIEDPSAPPFNYIGQLVTWDRANLIGLQAHIARVSGESWQQALARKRNFAEYILYGVFCDEVLGDRSRHALWSSDLTHSVWTETTRLNANAVLEGLEDRHVALHIQSTLRLPIEHRRSLLQAVIEQLPARSPPMTESPT